VSISTKIALMVMIVDTATLEIIIGNGVITAIAVAVLGYIFQRQQHNAEKDFEARSEAREYYKKIYGHIAIIDEITKSYVRSLQEGQEGKADVLCYENCSIEVQSSAKILERYKKAYSDFATYYLKSSSEGYEIFVSKKLRDLFGSFWRNAMLFDIHPELLKDKNKVREFNNIAEKTTDYMEELFGLKEDWRYVTKTKLSKSLGTLRGDKD
jgi:hypothetical protein